MLQFQELKKKEEKLGKAEAKQRMSSGSMGANNSTSNLDRIGTPGDKSLSNGEKPTTGVSLGTEDNMSAPSRIWQSMITSGPSEYQLKSPFRSTVHPSLCLPNRAVVVDEAHPSSIVAFTLAKRESADFFTNHLWQWHVLFPKYLNVNLAYVWTRKKGEICEVD